jgi:hypothetical protein
MVIWKPKTRFGCPHSRVPKTFGSRGTVCIQITIRKLKSQLQRFAKLDIIGNNGYFKFGRWLRSFVLYRIYCVWHGEKYNLGNEDADRDIHVLLT